MASNHRRQKKIEEHKRKRKQAQQKARTGNRSQGQIIRFAQNDSYGPTYISSVWKDEQEDHPSLISLVFTRKLENGAYLPILGLVDRTCLGLKTAHTLSPIDELALAGFGAELSERMGGLEPCSVEVALSVLYHAVDYAKALGFEPDKTVPLSLFGKRPEPLVTTPLCKREVPLYIAGPRDNTTQILKTLKKAMGDRKFDYVMVGSGNSAFGDLDFDEDILEEAVYGDGGVAG